MPGTRREAGFVALLGIVIAVAWAAFNPDAQGMGYAIGGVVFVIGAVLWLIHYSNDLRKEPKS